MLFMLIPTGILLYSLYKEFKEGNDWLPYNLDKQTSIKGELDKILVLSGHDMNFILWRRVYVVCFVSLFLIYTFLKKSVTYREVLISFIVMFLVMFSILFYFKRKASLDVHQNVKKSVEYIKLNGGFL